MSNLLFILFMYIATGLGVALKYWHEMYRQMYCELYKNEELPFEQYELMYFISFTIACAIMWPVIVFQGGNK